jgi:hypothetical protein
LSALRSVASAIAGLFVSDWRDTLAIIVVLVAGVVVSRYASSPVFGYLFALLLAVNLVWRSLAEARRRRGER